jgi:hypothetical protein
MTVKSDLISNLDGSLTLVSEQDDRALKKVADLNDKDRFHTRTTKYKGDSVLSHKVASIPMIVVEKMMREKVWGNQERMREWLNHPDNAPWRTTKGKV